MPETVTVSIRIADTEPVRELTRASGELAERVDHVAGRLERMGSREDAAEELRSELRRFHIRLAALGPSTPTG